MVLMLVIIASEKTVKTATTAAVAGPCRTSKTQPTLS